MCGWCRSRKRCISFVSALQSPDLFSLIATGIICFQIALDTSPCAPALLSGPRAVRSFGLIVDIRLRWLAREASSSFCADSCSRFVAVTCASSSRCMEDVANSVAAWVKEVVLARRRGLARSMSAARLTRSRRDSARASGVVTWRKPRSSKPRNAVSGRSRFRPAVSPLPSIVHRSEGLDSAEQPGPLFEAPRLCGWRRRSGSAPWAPRRFRSASRRTPPGPTQHGHGAPVAFTTLAATKPTT